MPYPSQPDRQRPLRVKENAETDTTTLYGLIGLGSPLGKHRYRQLFVDNFGQGG